MPVISVPRALAPLLAVLVAAPLALSGPAASALGAPARP